MFSANITLAMENVNETKEGFVKKKKKTKKEKKTVLI
jgi:hypothetical protein